MPIRYIGFGFLYVMNGLSYFLFGKRNRNVLNITADLISINEILFL